MTFQTEPHIPNNRDNFFQFGHTAWDRKELLDEPTPEWPSTLKGLSKVERAKLKKERIARTKNMHPIWTPDMEAAHDEMEETLSLRGSGSPECFGLLGPEYGGKTQIIQRFVDTFHCDNTTGRPYEDRPLTGDDMPNVPVVWLPPDNTTKQLMESFLAFYGIYLGGRPNAGQISREVMKQARQHQTQIVVMDDIHNLRGKNSAMDLKVMYEKLGQVMFLFTTITEDCPAFDMMHGGNQTLERTVWQNIEAPIVGSEEWHEVLGAFGEAMPWCMSDLTQLIDHSDLIHERTGGKTAKLAFLLRRMTAKMIRQNTDGEDEITAELIKSVKMTNFSDDIAA